MLVYILFLAGFALIIFGADFLINGASSLGMRLRIPPLIIGLTIVAMGTSLPELVINIFATANGDASLAVSNVLGSNIMNILLVTGIAAVIYPIRVEPGTTRRDIPVSVFAALLLGILVHDTLLFGREINLLSRIDGIIFIVLFHAFLVYSLMVTRSDFEDVDAPSQFNPVLKPVLLVVTGLAMLYVGGRWIVDGTVAVADLLHLSGSEVGLAIVATATSLPELATSVIAAIKKQPAVAIGNAIGSCIFNIFLVLGISAIILPLPFQAESNQDLLVVILSSVLLFLFVFTGKGRKIHRIEGVIMVILYVAYIAYRLS